MLLDNDKKIKNIVNAQIVKVFFPFIVAKTECGSLVKVNISNKEMSDPLFWEAIAKVLKAKLWVPIGKKYHQLLDNDWLVYPEKA